MVTLSDKIKRCRDMDDCWNNYIFLGYVKQFIKDLKNEIAGTESFSEQCQIIDKLAGDKLI